MIRGYDYLSELAPRLATRLTRLAFGNFPTPLSQPESISLNLSIKHDEFTDECYGGNKIRKLTYALGQARQHGVKRVATFGAAGSNHALATAIQARKMGFSPIALLCHQPPTPNIRATLRSHLRIGTEVVYWGGDAAQRRAIMRATLHDRDRPSWLIPMGGSSWLGAVGFIAAAAELRAQVGAGLVASPRRIYIPMGTLGSAVGLSVGLAACRLDCQVHAIRVVDPAWSHPDRVRQFGQRLIAMCQRVDPTFKAPDWEKHIVVRESFLGPGYAHATPAGIDAVNYAKTRLGLQLETTYSGKALAALLADSRDKSLAKDPVLFWNTYHGKPPKFANNRLAGAQLPSEFDRYLNNAD